MIRKWENLPEEIKNESTQKYYNILYKKQFSLFVKRIFDVVIAFFLFVAISPIFIIISIAIKIDSKGPVLFRQVRVTQYGKKFCIFKFRTMVNHAETMGTKVTTNNDNRVTRVGKFIRKNRLDEIPQLFNIILGDMSFVGTRPEVICYVEKYTDEMMATLLLPAGVTSEASILYKEEEKMLSCFDDVDKIYMEVVLPEKMKFNLKSIEEFSFFGDLRTMIKTVVVGRKKDSSD